MSKHFVLPSLLLVLWGSLSLEAQASAVPESTPLPQMETSYGTFTLGKKPYPEGTRAAWVAEGRALASIPAGVLPAGKMLKGAADNRGNLPPIGNQGSLGSCVHWAGTYNTKSANMKLHDPTLNLSATSNQCSPRFTYNLSNGGADVGGYGHEPFEIFMRYGVASLNQLPYTTDYSTLPDKDDFLEGLHRRTTNYVWLWDWNPGTSEINELKAFLDTGAVASCGVYAESSFDAWGPGDAPWVGSTCTINDINHMVTVCGYGTGYYLVANSWGTSFGSNGYIVVDSDYFENYFSDILFPLEGTYEAATNYATIDIQHGTRSDIRSLTFTVNGSTAWDFPPLGENMPLGTGSIDTDSRNDLHLAVDLSSAAWSGANTVTARCSDTVSGTSGTLTNFTVHVNGVDYVSVDTPVSIPDNTGASASAVIQTQGAPVFGGNPGPVSATTGVATAFTVSATGSPTPTLALQGTTASSGYGFTAGTGQLSYTPPQVDLGARTFTFTASNSEGVATQTVSVTVLEPPPAAPASIWASATNSTDFTAAWSTVSGATSYQLDVSTNASFGVSGGGGGVQLGESFDSGLASSYTTGNQTLTSGVWYTDTVYQELSGDSRGGTGHAARLNDDTPGASLRTPALNTVGAVTFWYRELNSGGGTFKLQKSYDGSSWVDVDTQSFSGTTYVQYSNNVDDAAGTVYVRVLNDDQSGHLIVDDFEVASYGSSTPDYVAGYSNLTVSGTSQSVTGLTTGETYYFRVRAVSGGGTSVNSSTATVTLISTTVPVFDAIGTQQATTEVATAFSVSATGTPTPALVLRSTTASLGYGFTAGTGELAYTPPEADAGTQTFTFTASNTAGVATQAVTVEVTSALTNAFEDWLVGKGESPADTNYLPNADMDLDTMTTWEEFLADTDPSLIGSCLAITGRYTIATGGGTGEILMQFPASTGRYYQLEYCTDLTNHTIGVSNIGWGVPGMVITNNAPGTWYGVIRALLQEP